MTMTFSMRIKKFKLAELGRAQGHNQRTHLTSSQLRPEAWITPEGCHTGYAWRDDVVDRARKLVKRKDGVVAISFIFQLGNQRDWREEPTSDFPEGKPKSGGVRKLNQFSRGIKQWTVNEFGQENILSIELHTDESSPHLHVLVIPVKDGRLQAKHWLNGAAACAALRRRAYTEVNRFIPCTYVPGASGGKPHDPSKGAGKNSNDRIRVRLANIERREKELERERSKVIDAYLRLDFVKKELEEAEAELNRVNARLEEKKQEDIIRQSYESKLSSDRYRP